MSKTMKIGPLGRMVEIPYPDSGMGFDNNADVEVTELVGGGRAVYRAPITHKTFSMNWQGGLKGLSKNLQPLIDLYNGAYVGDADSGELLYMIDPSASEYNLLPARWASSWQLAFCANGIHKPTVVSYQTVPLPARRAVKFKSANVSDALVLSRYLEINIPIVAGRVPYFNVWGSSTENSGIDVRLRNSQTNLWEAPVRRLPASDLLGEPLALMTADKAAEGVYDAVKLSVVVNHNGELVLGHMALGYLWDYTENGKRAFPPGNGVGALQFTNQLGGTLQSTTIDRIGLSADLTEVRDAPSDLPL